MSKKASTYFPEYQLNLPGDRLRGTFTFRHEGNAYSTRVPFMSSMFGMTQTQKEALRWACAHETRPVVSISHEKPGAPDKKVFRDLSELHRTLYPYAMATAEVRCLWNQTRQLKIYFCDITFYDSAKRRLLDCGKGCYIEEIR